MKIFNILKTCVILSFFAASSLWSGADLLAQDKILAPKQVLAIFVFKQGMPWAYHIEQSLRKALAKKSAYAIELNVEYADQSRFPEKAYRSRVIDLYRYKYSKQKMDLVLVMGDESVELMAEYDEVLFGNVPVVLITTEEITPGLLKPNMTSMVWGFDFTKTGALIQDLLPKTKNLFVISGISLTDQKLKNLAVEALVEFEDQYIIHYLDDLSKEDLLLKVTQLPENSAIFFITLFRDVNGQSFIPREVMSEVSEKANAPTFGIVDLYLGHGIVGGNLLSADYQGKKYAGIVEKILNGEPLTSLKFMDKDNQLLFDWRQLKRWSIDEDRLPADSIVRHREASIWAEHKKEIIGIIIIIFTLTFSLIGIIIQHRWRRQAEEEAQKLRNERAHISRVLAMGEIAASLAHELNQPLSAIRSYAQAAQRFLNNDPSEPDEVSKALTGIVAGNKRAEEVIQRIRMALKKEPFKLSRLNVKDIIQEVILLVSSKADEQNISLKPELASDLPPVLGDHIQLQQVLLNLIYNGIEAIIDERNTPVEILVQALSEKPDAVTISVRDNGAGIKENQEDILFDAFYTTKSKGMGMGLSISRSIIEDHGGRLWFTRNQDKGTTFYFTVPVYEEENK